MTVLTHYEPGDNTTTTDHRTLGPLPKLTRAIDFDQRKVNIFQDCIANFGHLSDIYFFHSIYYSIILLSPDLFIKGSQ